MAHSKSSSKMSSFVPDDIEKGASNSTPATSALQQHAQEIRANSINWQSYVQLQMLTDGEASFISKLDESATARAAVIAAQPEMLARAFFSVLERVNKEQTVAYALILLDDLLQEDKSRVDIFKEHCPKSHPSWSVVFVQMLNRPHPFAAHMTSRVLSKMACWSSDLLTGPDLQFFLTWLKDQLNVQGNEYVQSVCRCLQMLLRIDSYRLAFVQVDDLNPIVNALMTRLNFQLQYQLIFCLWVLSFNGDIAARMSKYRIIPILADILTDTQKEKVSRIILALMTNLIEKSTDPAVVKENCIAMVQCKVMKQIEFLEHKKFDDEDILADIAFLKERMEASLRDLSSFDEYVTELHSGRLEWSPVHRSELFWRENVSKFNDVNYQLLRQLISILETSDDPLVLSVACFDLGEYVRHYARGKHIVEQLGGKTRVMTLLAHQEPTVRYEALLAVQKLMVHNWEYLGRQLEKEQGQKLQEHQIKAL